MKNCDTNRICSYCNVCPCPRVAVSGLRCEYPHICRWHPRPEQQRAEAGRLQIHRPDQRAGTSLPAAGEVADPSPRPETDTASSRLGDLSGVDAVFKPWTSNGKASYHANPGNTKQGLKSFPSNKHSCTPPFACEKQDLLEQILPWAEAANHWRILGKGSGLLLLKNCV
jgi:hypothetical protein